VDIELNPLICNFCKRQLAQVCLESCAEEGLFRHLSPIELYEWKQRPNLPSMDDLLKLRAAGRLALISLVLHYLIQEVRDIKARD
jgi:hypothetical protein